MSNKNDDAQPHWPGDSGMNAVLAAWYHHRAEGWTVAINAQRQGAWQPGTGSLGIEPDLREVEHRIITPEEFRADVEVLGVDPWLLRHLADHPEEIRRLTRWEAQAMIAELLKGRGYQVQLGPKGRDGGVDIFAERAADFGPDLTLVQVKHPDEGNMVGEPTVKLLQREVVFRNATRGLVATTVTFTATALTLIEEYRYTMSAADREKLQQWLKEQRSTFNARP